MSLTTAETFHVLAALAVLLVFAHGFGHLFAYFRQPRVVGEILGGLLLGPTFFGYFLPELQEMLFPSTDKVTYPVLGAIYQLGLLLLMFCSGIEVRSKFEPGERRTALAITATGTLIPFGLGLLFLKLFDLTGWKILEVKRFYGEANNDTAFLLVFAIAIAVTSIPVISRIMLDLKILETSFARIVLGAAVVEDILLYVVLAIAIGMVGQQEGDISGLQSLLQIAPDSGYAKLYHVLIPLAFIGFSLLFGPRLFVFLSRFRYNLLMKSSPVAFLLVIMLIMTGLCILLGITPIFGAFVAGMVIGSHDDPRINPSPETIKNFSFAFFVPVYFAIVGLKLDLVHAFEPIFFLIFLLFACGAKSFSVYAGARGAGETKQGAWNLAVAMNARGGPGIVLASVAYDAAIVGESFYVVLVMLAIITSLMAGSWLGYVVRSGESLR